MYYTFLKWLPWTKEPRSFRNSRWSELELDFHPLYYLESNCLSSHGSARYSMKEEQAWCRPCGNNQKLGRPNDKLLKYRKVTSSSDSNTFRFEANAGLFRLSTKGIFDAYVLWLFGKKFIFELVMRIRTRNSTVCKWKAVVKITSYI